MVDGLKATGKIEVVADLGGGVYQYNSREDSTGVVTYSTMKIAGDQLTLSYDCDEEDVADETCDAITGDSAANRSIFDANSATLNRVK